MRPKTHRGDSEFLLVSSVGLGSGVGDGVTAWKVTFTLTFAFTFEMVKVPPDFGTSSKPLADATS